MRKYIRPWKSVKRTNRFIKVRCVRFYFKGSDDLPRFLLTNI